MRAIFYVCVYVCVCMYVCGIEGQSGKIVCQGGKPDTHKFHSSYIGMWLRL